MGGAPVSADPFIAEVERMASPRILTIDIETTPHITYQWSPRDQWTPAARMIERGRILSFAAKWYGSPDVDFVATWDDGGIDVAVRRAWDLLNEADVVITYNGDRFDIPRLRGEFAREGLPPVVPFRSVDLIKTVRRMGWPYNSLNEACRELNIPGKIETGGFDLWRNAVAGDGRARSLMAKYNINDVRITERLWLRLRPWLPGTANLALWSADGQACPNCLSRRRTRTQDIATDQTKYGGYRCRTCGAVYRHSFIKHRVNTRVAK